MWKANLYLSFIAAEKYDKALHTAILRLLAHKVLSISYLYPSSYSNNNNNNNMRLKIENPPTGGNQAKPF